MIGSFSNNNAKIAFQVASIWKYPKSVEPVWNSFFSDPGVVGSKLIIWSDFIPENLSVASIRVSISNKIG